MVIIVGEERLWEVVIVVTVVIITITLITVMILVVIIIITIVIKVIIFPLSLPVSSCSSYRDYHGNDCIYDDYSCRSGRGRKAEKRRDFRHYQVYPHISSIHGKYLSFCLLCISDCVKIFSEPSKYISVYTVGFVQRAILAISIS